MDQTSCSPEDAELLRLLFLGCDQVQIARDLHLSRRTVQRRIKSLMNKFDAPGMLALGARAGRAGLLQVEQRSDNRSADRSGYW
jgi:DNA-binding NarL/FixJ family response regulator